MPFPAGESSRGAGAHQRPKAPKPYPTPREGILRAIAESDDEDEVEMLMADLAALGDDD